MKTRKTLFAALVGAFAAAPAGALARPAAVAHQARVGNKIVLFKSIGGVKLGITPAQARRKLGKPSHTIRVGGKVAEYQFSKGNTLVISVDFDTLNSRDLANGVFGYEKSMRTSKGIHPGSTVKQLKRAYGHALHHFPGGYALYLGHPGSVGSSRTDFPTFDGKISDIDVQTVLNDL